MYALRPSGLLLTHLLRQYGQEGGGEAEVPQATRSRYSDGTGAILNLEREGIIDDFISSPSNPAIQADLIYFNQIVSTAESIIPDFSGLTIGDSNDPYEVGYFNTLSFSNIVSESNNISIDVDSVSFEGNIVVDGDTTFNGDVDFPGAVTLSSITTGGASIPGTVTGTWTLTAGSTFEATYADLAENFRADEDYEPGTVVKLGGTEEITMCDTPMCSDVFGVISTNPAYIMNAGGGIPVALQGRTPVKLIGGAKKGDRLVSAGQAGYAMILKEDKYYDPRIIIGRALEDVENDSGTVMAVIGVK